MKTSVSILLFALAAPFSVAQSPQLTFQQDQPQPMTAAQRQAIVQAFERPDAAPSFYVTAETPWCPVVLLSAVIATPARYLPVDDATREANSGSLNLKFKNMSDKKIEAAALKVEVKVKRSIYDLDSLTLTLHLELSGIDVASDELSRAIPLRVPAFGLGQVVLQQVTYADGSTWSPMTENACRLSGPSAVQVAK
jgi:hypothetical protein